MVRGLTSKMEQPIGGIPAEQAEYQKKLKAWLKMDSMVQKLMILNVNEQALLHLVNCESAKDMWDKFTSVYEGKNATNATSEVVCPKKSTRKMILRRTLQK